MDGYITQPVLFAPTVLPPSGVAVQVFLMDARSFLFCAGFFFEAPLFTVHRIGRLATGLGSSDAKRLSRPSSHLSDRRHALLFFLIPIRLRLVSLCAEKEKERERTARAGPVCLSFFSSCMQKIHSGRTTVLLGRKWGWAWLGFALCFCFAVASCSVLPILPATHTYIPFSLSASGQYRPSFCPFYPSSYLAPRA
jgi:hypothetical protein